MLIWTTSVFSPCLCHVEPNRSDFPCNQSLSGCHKECVTKHFGNGREMPFPRRSLCVSSTEVFAGWKQKCVNTAERAGRDFRAFLSADKSGMCLAHLVSSSTWAPKLSNTILGRLLLCWEQVGDCLEIAKEAEIWEEETFYTKTRGKSNHFTWL